MVVACVLNFLRKRAQLHEPPLSYEDANVTFTKYKGYLNEFSFPGRIQRKFMPRVRKLDQIHSFNPSTRRIH